MPDKLLSPTEAAIQLGLKSERTIRRWVNNGKLKGVKISYNVVRIPQSEVDRLLSENETCSDTD